MVRVYCQLGKKVNNSFILSLRDSKGLDQMELIV